MRALSLTQPWATFVARGLKPVENRKQYFAEVIGGVPLAGEILYTDYNLPRAQSGEFTWTAPGVLGNGTVPTWA